MEGGERERIGDVGKGKLMKGLERIEVNEENELFLNVLVRVMGVWYEGKIGEMKEWREEVGGMGGEGEKNFVE